MQRHDYSRDVKAPHSLALAEPTHRDVATAVVAYIARSSGEADAARPCHERLKVSPRFDHKIERQPKAPDANSTDASSLATARQDRRSAPARRRVGLVRDQGQRDLCLGPARLGSGLQSQDRRNQSASGEEEAMTTRSSPATAS